MSLSASAAPRSPATVEKRANISVCLRTSEKICALVYLVMSWVTVNVPKAPAPFACIRRSGITSRSKCAIFSRSQMFSSNAGPRGYSRAPYACKGRWSLRHVHGYPRHNQVHQGEDLLRGRQTDRDVCAFLYGSG